MNPDSQRNQHAQFLDGQNYNQNSNWTRDQPITPYNLRVKTDVCWIVLYMALTTVLVVAFYSAFILEKDRNLLKPEDPDGRKCGQQDARQYPYIYFPTPFASDLNRTVCVKDCPTSSQSIIECLPNKAIKSCQFTMTDQMNRTNQFIVYPTTRNNFIWLCQPSSKILFDAVNQKINTHHLFMNLQRVYEARYVILVVCPAVSILMVLGYVFILTIIEDFIFLFKGFIISFAIILFALAIYCFTPSAKKFFGYMPQIGVILLIIALLFTVYMIYNRDHITRGLRLVQIGVQYIRNNRSLVFISIIFFLLWAIIFALELIALIYIYSMDTVNSTPGLYQFAYMAGIQNTWFVKMLLIIAIVHYFWTNFILYSIGEYICMAAGTFWILEIKNNFKNALFTLFRFHIGTVIFGSIANVFLGKFTQFLYLFMPKENDRFLCCFCPKLSQFYKGSCFQNYLGVFNDLNYIRVAMKGQDLVTAGRNLSNNLVQNLNYVSRAYKLARLVVFISKILAGITTTFICYLVITFNPTLQTSLITNIIIFLLSLLLIGFAFESYDRSFEVILITILIKHKTYHQAYDDNNVKLVSQWIAGKEGLGEFLEHSALEKRRSLQKLVLLWFDEEKQSQKKISNNVESYNS